MLKELQSQKKYHSLPVKVARKISMYILIFLGIFVLSIPTLVVATVFAQYRPDAILTLNIDDDRTQVNKVQNDKLKLNDVEYNALTYNTGFASYNQDMHFFMDGKGQGIVGGQGWAQSKQATENALLGVNRIINANHDTGEFIAATSSAASMDLRGTNIFRSEYDVNAYWDSDTLVDDLSTEGIGTFDFIAIQETDIDSTRSYHVNQYDVLRGMKFSDNISDINPTSVMPELKDVYTSCFAYNFVVPFIPIPLNQMHGQVLGGISTLSKYTMQDEAQRIALEDISTFPLNLFELKRCYTLTRYNIENSDKQFVFINAHFSAYDKSGVVRRMQLTQINDVFKTEQDKGNYVLLAGDWNQTLPETYGYEGSDVYDYDIAIGMSDPSIAPWDYATFDHINGNFASPRSNDFRLPPSYQSDWEYNKGDLVTYFSEDDLTNTPLNDRYMSNSKKHTYQAMIDNPTEAPVLASGEKSQQWRYHLKENYQNTSLTKEVRETLLTVTNEGAQIYGNHAVPSLRDGGIAYRGVGDSTIYKSNIDGFMVSSNIEVICTYGYDTNFIYSDHNPVSIKFKLIG